MKKKILFPVLTLMIFSALSANYSGKKNNPVGKWYFEVQNAPQAYASGTVEVNRIKKKHSVIMMFNGSDNKYQGTNVKFEKNTLTFNVYIAEQDVAITLKLESEQKMTGKAITSQDEVPMTLTKNHK